MDARLAHKQPTHHLQAAVCDGGRMQRKTKEAGRKTPQVMNVDSRQKDVASLATTARVLLVEL
jgi:hypothetical protein